jgi:hypothetical protein
MSTVRRADLCIYAMPEALEIVEEMNIPRERDTLVFSSFADQVEFERRVGERRKQKRGGHDRRNS